MKHLKRGMLLLLVFLFTMMFFSLSSALIGISPPVHEVNFYPELSETYYFYFINDVDVPLNISVQGDLAEYVKLPETRIIGSGVAAAVVNLPEVIERPGIHEIYIYGKQSPLTTKAGFYLIGAAYGVIRVHVPFDGPYADIFLTVKNANAGNDSAYTVKIDNIGNAPLSGEAALNIKDSKGKLVSKIPLGNVNIGAMESTSIEGIITTTDLAPGFYSAEAVVTYNGKETRKMQNFRLGQLLVEVYNYTKEFERGKINKFEIHVESQWNDPLDPVRAEVLFPQYPGLRVETPSIALEGFQTGTLLGYLDTSAITTDTFDGLIRLQYADKITEKEVSLRFDDAVNYTLILLIAGAALLFIGILAGVFFFVRRKYA